MNRDGCWKSAAVTGAATAYGRTSILVLMFVPMLVCFMTLWPFNASANSKSDELRRKTADIALLQQQLQDRIHQAEQVYAALLAQQHELMGEIHLLRKQHQIQMLTKAEQIPRMRYNIELLRSLIAYSDLFDSRIRYFQMGRDKMSYLLRLIEDDIKMIDTLSDLKIDALTTQISMVINRYLPDAHIIQIDPNKVELLSAQAVWETILKAKEHG
jgi:hypothetical protein